jgi:hypothetical protein
LLLTVDAVAVKEDDGFGGGSRKVDGAARIRAIYDES